jgi:hypothetical protein
MYSHDRCVNVINMEYQQYSTVLQCRSIIYYRKVRSDEDVDIWFRFDVLPPFPFCMDVRSLGAAGIERVPSNRGKCLPRPLPPRGKTSFTDSFRCQKITSSYRSLLHQMTAAAGSCSCSAERSLHLQYQELVQSVLYSFQQPRTLP